MDEPLHGLAASGISRAASARARATVLQLVNWLEVAAGARPLAFAISVPAVCFLVALALLSPSYQTNDDALLSMIAAGKGQCLAPDEHLIFTHVAIGQILKSLYTAWPSVAWYGGYLLLAQYLAHVAILYCATARGYSRWRVGMYLLFFGTAGIFYLNNMQFTATACLLAQAGILLWLVVVQRRTAASGSRVWVPLVAGTGLLVLASLIRLDCFWLTFILALPAVICLLGWRPRLGVAWPLATTACICVAFVWGLAAYHDAYYQRDAEWASFLRYNKQRIKFNDYGWTQYTAETSPVFAAVGWTENDHAMIEHWFYDDPLYGESQLQQVVASYPWRAKRLTFDYLANCLRAIVRDKSLWPIILVLPICCWGMERSKKNVAALAGSAVSVGVVLLAIAVLNKSPPSRVYFPALTFPLMLMLAFGSERLEFPRRRWLRLAPLVLAGVGVVMAGHRQWRHSVRTLAVRNEVAACFAELAPKDDQLYASWATDFPYEAISPFDNLQSLADLHLLIVSWPQGTPIAQAMKRRFGIENTALALFEQPDVFLLGNATSHPLLARFVEEHFGASIRFAARRAGPRPFDLAGQFGRVADSGATAIPAPAPAPRAALR